MKLESHVSKLKEHISGLEWGIMQENHSAIGFHASAGSIELLSILLHKLEIISAGFQINHVWFRSSNMIENKFDFDFTNKNKILSIMKEITKPLMFLSMLPLFSVFHNILFQGPNLLLFRRLPEHKQPNL